MNLIRKITATAALVALVSGLFTTGVSAANTADIENANKLANAGIINDHSDNPAEYELNRNLLRQELAATVRGVAKIEKASTYESLFNDVTETTPNSWAWKSVNALRNADMIAANDYFRPEANVTNAEAIGMVVKACRLGYEYDSSNSDSWQKQVVDFAASKGVVESFSDYNALATRGFVFSAAANCVEEESSSETDDLICQLLGNCEEGTEGGEEGTEGENTTPVVTGEDMLMVELSPETPADGNVAAGAARVKMLAFDVSAGSSDVTLKSAKLRFTGLGDSKVISDLAMYDGLTKVTKGSKKFYSDDNSDLSFERDVVIKAGETKTLFVTATISATAADDYQTLQISLTDLEASSTVKGDDLVGSTLTPILVKNIGKVELKTRKVTSTLNVGEMSTLADFSLEEDSDKESVTVKSITFEVGGSVDSDDIADLALYADGSKVDGVTFSVNNSEIEAELSHTIAKDKKVNYLLKGAITGSVNDTIKLSFEENAIYVVGDNSDVSIAVDTSSKELSESKIEGSEINIAFNRSEIDEAKPGADDVVLGNIDLSSAADYNIKKLQVTVSNSSSQVISTVVKTLELKGLVYDKVVNEGTTTATYTFEDIDLQEGVAKKLPLTMDLLDGTALSGANLTVNVKVIEVKDEDNNKTYTSTATGDLNVSKILSSNSFTAKTVEVKTASLELTSTEVNDTELVLGNGVKTVLYKGRLSVGDADKITLRNIDFVPAAANNLVSGVNISDIVSDATLNIGGKTFKADVETNRIDFNSINANIAAGADNVEMLLVATLKDNGAITGSSNVLSVQVETASVDVDDGEGDTLPTASVITTGANTQLTKTTLQDKGDFLVETTATGNNKDKVKDVVLAGTNSVNLGEVKIQADKEDAKVKRLTFEVASTNIGTPAGAALTVVKAGNEGNQATPSGYAGTYSSGTLTTSAPLDTGDQVFITVNGTAYNQLVTSSHAAAMTALASSIQGNSGVATATAVGNVININSNSGAALTLTYPAINNTSGGDNQTLTTAITQSPANQSVQTLTYNRALTAGDSVSATVNGTTYTNTTLSGLAGDIQGNTNVDSASATTTVITINGKTDGTPVVLSATATPYPGSGDKDLSSTFKDVKLMEGSKVLADNATLAYVSGKTYITFKDFTLDATDNKRDAMLVSNLNKYTTSGSETSANLSTFTITPYTGGLNSYYDVEGVSSQEDMGKTVTANATKSVSIVPVTVTVSIVDKFGNGDQNAKIRFNIDKGNNVLSSDAVKVDQIRLESAITGSGLTVRNDDGTAFLTGSTAATLTGFTQEISNGDEWRLNTTTLNQNVVINVNGIHYKVGTSINDYKITNDKVIDLNSYTN